LASVIGASTAGRFFCSGVSNILTLTIFYFKD
jgi:hypothetical protein